MTARNRARDLAVEEHLVGLARRLQRSDPVLADLLTEVRRVMATRHQDPVVGQLCDAAAAFCNSRRRTDLRCALEKPQALPMKALK